MRAKSNPKAETMSVSRVENSILTIRGHRVILDSDLARIYGVTTKRLNEQVKRNRVRFPPDFMFQLTPAEKAGVVANCDHLRSLVFSPNLPFAFTEHGTVMLASVLSSTVAVEASIQVVRAFVRIRELLNNNRDLAAKLAQLEKKYDRQFATVFEAIRQLMEPPPLPSQRQIGF